MEINGFEYPKEEVLAALKKVGYRIVSQSFYHEEHIHGSRFIKHPYDLECAVKEDQEPTEETYWAEVAKKEFEKPVLKPQLA